MAAAARPYALSPKKEQTLSVAGIAFQQFVALAHAPYERAVDSPVLADHHVSEHVILRAAPGCPQAPGQRTPCLGALWIIEPAAVHRCHVEMKSWRDSI